MRRFPIFPKGARVIRAPHTDSTGEVGTIAGRRSRTTFWVCWDSEPKKRTTWRGYKLRWAEED